jgi:Protein of unknown function (DUF2569)
VVIPFLVIRVAGIAYLLRGRRPETGLRAFGVLSSTAPHPPGTPTESDAARTIRPWSEATPQLFGIRGWLLVYMVVLAAELAHDLMLTIGSLIIYADPSLAGLDSFIPLWALLIYVVSNFGFVAYGVVLFVLMLRKRRAAIANNNLFNALSVAFLVSWFFLGAKSPAGTVVDSVPALAAIAYFARSRRVRNTFTAAPAKRSLPADPY